jgi:hypothetical protein
VNRRYILDVAFRGLGAYLFVTTCAGAMGFLLKAILAAYALGSGIDVIGERMVLMMYVSLAAGSLPELCLTIAGIVLVVHGGRLAARLAPGPADHEAHEGPATPAAALGVVFAAVGVYVVLWQLAGIPRPLTNLWLWAFWDFGPDGGALRGNMLTDAISGGLSLALTLAVGAFLAFRARRLAAKFCARPWLAGEGDPRWGPRALGVALGALGAYLIVLGAVGIAGSLGEMVAHWGSASAFWDPFLGNLGDSESAGRFHLMISMAKSRIVKEASTIVSRALLLVFALLLIARADRVAARLVGGGGVSAPAGREES